MLRGRTVTVRLRDYGETSADATSTTTTTRDSFGNDIESYGQPIEVDNVLIEGGSAEELDESRPEGVRAAYTLRFPKSWTEPMRGALVELPDPFSWGNPYRAIGVVKYLQTELCPLDWNGVLEVEAVDG